MQNADLCACGIHLCIGEVYGISDVSVLDVVDKLGSSHNCAVVLGLGSGSAQVRNADNVLYADKLIGGEVSDVASDLAAFNSSQNSSGISQLASCEVEYSYAVLHNSDGLFTDSALGISIVRNVDSDIVGSSIEVVNIGNGLYAGLKGKRSLYGEERIIADHLHAKAHCGICDQNADSTQTDNAQSLSADLGTCEVGLALFYLLADIFLTLEGGNPVNSVSYLSGGKEETCDNKLLNSVCIGTGSVENNDALFCAAVNGNVVYACACSGTSISFLTL